MRYCYTNTSPFGQSIYIQVIISRTLGLFYDTHINGTGFVLLRLLNNYN